MSTEALPDSKVGKARTLRPHPIRNGLLCTLVVAAALSACYPVAEIGFIDDWSYIRTALDFARTGHFIYNGWATAMLGWQVIWGALFIKLFGFSFTVVRLSTWLIALASVFLFHQILLRFGIAPKDAVFGTLTLGLSPLFLPLAAGFMTDVPGLFVILVCIYMCQRAVAATSDRSALVWLCSAALVDVAGGTVRQIAWLGALVMVPSTALLLRKRRGMLLAGASAWAASLIGIFGCMYWFSRQPYSVSEGSIEKVPIHPAQLLHLMVLLLRTLLCLMLLLLPVLAAWLPGVRRLNLKARGRLAASILGVIALYIFLNSRSQLQKNILPWISHILMQLGVCLAPSSLMLGSVPATLTLWLRVAISLLVIATGLVFAEQMFAKNLHGEGSAFARRNSSWREVGWLLGPFALSYLALLLPRGIHGLIFDRYLFALMVVAIVALLKLQDQQLQEQQFSTGDRRLALELPWLRWLVLSVFALYTVGATHDWFSMYRARILAISEIRASGVPRTAIQAGVEYDGWTQVESGGHANDSFVRVPKGAYDPNVPPLPVAPDCQLWSASFFPLVKPKYFLTLDQMDCLAPSNYPAVVYRAWLPPFDRRVFIQRLPASSK